MLLLVDAAPILLFDFDGTTCLGDDPVLAYAHEVEKLLPADEFGVIETELNAFLRGDRGSVFLDGYAAVAQLVGDRCSLDDLAGCYLRSREQLAHGVLDVHAPAGLADLLAGTDATAVLVTNAPDIGIDSVLGQLGLAQAFDHVVTDAAKPAGMRKMLSAADIGERSVAAIGDIWINDLAVPHEFGYSTAYIDRFGRGDGDPTWRAVTPEALIDELATWLEVSTGEQT